MYNAIFLHREFNVMLQRTWLSLKKNVVVALLLSVNHLMERNWSILEVNVIFFLFETMFI